MQEAQKKKDYKAISAYFIAGLLVIVGNVYILGGYGLVPPVSSEAIGYDLIPAVIYMLGISLIYKGYKMLRGEK
ncbi:hypothetical protein A3E39_03255 [Candidatus Uhrbacteria bacterium RIFCSPHIGHO2_12_FULL_60_25]|uniref:DUF378 domain-containing protein n=1 Tax=Candidatus Uhrbacteria bacterium RIFCSPHIGHO2_12_FULL_60_25 TaxID=1802399 RepID=A0A1F7UND3_9BACT|nr:MAG: hypothetical protein A3D73_00755 [Candidatus Uhrbacteria bacterium RIFCSPHIGHO2_02_FULL_60_44]OGL79800.1 MAG: hypothetical protein A3E39_03255 [Candidatus Uhrbacteria bacterium RIFCSPHIGHO2_12_FULL_60_25]